MVVSFIKRLLRGRHLFFILAAFLLFYVTLNYLLFYWVDPQAAGAGRGVNDDIMQQIVSLSYRHSLTTRFGAYVGRVCRARKPSRAA